MHLATYKSGLDEIAWGIKRVRSKASLAHLFGSMAHHFLDLHLRVNHRAGVDESSRSSGVWHSGNCRRL